MNYLEVEIFNYFPKQIVKYLKEYVSTLNYELLEEIRIRVNRPILIKYNNQLEVLDYIVKSEDILEIMGYITENSIYSYQKQICEGFITLKGGHRVGISGNVVMEDNKVININYIYSLNFRIAKQIIGVSSKIVDAVFNKNQVYNTLIISPPGAGKTTILRDLIRILSSYKTIGVVDERGEIAAMYKDEPQNDLGLKVDILNNITKPLGIKMLIRSMSPDIVCADEIGTKDDVEAIKYAVTSGVNGIFTAHSDSIENIKLNPILNELLELKLIDRIIILDKDNRENIKIHTINKND